MKPREHPVTRVFFALGSDSRVKLLAFANQHPEGIDTQQLMAHLGQVRKTVWENCCVLASSGLLVQVPGVPTDPPTGGRPPCRWRITPLARDLIARVLQDVSPPDQAVQ